MNDPRPTRETEGIHFKARFNGFKVVILLISVLLTIGLSFGARLDAGVFETLNTFIEKSDASEPKPMAIPSSNSSIAAKDELQLPQIAWLMTFEHSGTTFTIRTTRELSQKDTGLTFPSTQLVPVYENSKGGPYWRKKLKMDRPGSNEYLLTKTHCGSRCMDCPPSRYIETPKSFLDKCCGTAGNEKYSPDIVKKVVHLIRNPFDNVASRYRYKEKHRIKIKGVSLNKNFTTEGFQEFCKLLEVDYQSEENRLLAKVLGPELVELSENIPCFLEFFRYVQWHNLSFETTDKTLGGIPTMVLHYERFGTSFEETSLELLNFLNLERKSRRHSEFIQGKTYSHFYTPEQREAIKNVVHVMASNKTWENLKHYFDRQ